MVSRISLVITIVIALVAVGVSATEPTSTNTTLGLCSFSGTCFVGGIEGVCVSISQGCCQGGEVTAGLCPGSGDIKCCTNHPCSTPQGSGTCKQTSACAGRAVPGYCSGPSNLECCVSGGGCTLGAVATGGSCDSDSPIRGITNQIIKELAGMGHSFRTMDSRWVHCPGFNCTLQSSAANSLEQTAQSKNDYITLNSAFRSSAEQYILWYWYMHGHKCGISLAAKPGQSNHEGGRAIDTSAYGYWNSALSSHGWVHSYPGSDPVHFDFGGAPDISSRNLLAFQQLHNRYSPNKISADGIFGPATEKALSEAPCNGW